MTGSDRQLEDAADLRRQAEQTLRERAARTSADAAAPSPEETQRLLHELQVHQIELEMQNEELRRAQAELDASRARYFDLYDLAPVGYLSLGESGLVLEANLTVAGLLGVPRGAMTGQPITRFIFKEDQDIYYRHRKQLLETGAPQTCELRMLRADAAPFWARLEATAVRDGESGAAVFRVVLSDIAELKRAEQEKLVLERRLLHAQKLESLGVLAGGIAHDFNNILAGIMGHADLALLRLSSPEPAREHVQMIVRAAERAAELTRLMLAYSGKGRFVVEPVSLSRAVENSRDLLALSVSKKAAITYNLAADLPTTQANASQLQQVILSLVINASEALGENRGAIAVSTDTVRCGRDDLATVDCGSDLSEGLYVRLEVADTGCGMDRETLGKIFDPFFTTKFTGRGLGLAAVQGIVRGHKGAIRVSSEPGRGTKVQVLFPATGAVSASPARQPAD